MRRANDGVAEEGFLGLHLLDGLAGAEFEPEGDEHVVPQTPALDDRQAEACDAQGRRRRLGFAAGGGGATGGGAGQGSSSGGDQATVRAPGVAVDAQDDKASVRLPGMHIEADGDNASVRIGGFHIDANDSTGSVDIEGSAGGDDVSVQARDNSTEVRAVASGEATRASWILTDNRPSPEGWRLVGYEARGPVGGPLVVATVRSRDGNRGRVFEDVKELVTLNVGE